MKLLVSCAILPLSLVVMVQTACKADYLNAEPPQSTESAQPTPTSPSTTTPTTPSNGTTATNAGGPPVLIDDKDAGWTWTNMEEYSSPYLYEKLGRTGGPGSYAVYTFHGTGVEISGIAGQAIIVDGVSHTLGSAAVFVDGKQQTIASVRLASTNYRDQIFKIDGLPYGDHLLHVEPQGGWIVVNFITVLNTPPPPAPTPQQQETANNDGPDTGGPVYRILPRNSLGICLDVTPGPINGATIDLYDPDPDRLQLWHVNALGGNKYTITPVGHPNEAIWIVPPSPDNKDSQAFLYTFNGSPNQILTLNDINAPYYTVEGQGQNMAMSVTLAGYTDGAPIYGMIQNDSQGQQWEFVKAGN